MLKSCIVVPCYNEERRLDREAFLRFSKENDLISFCFVNDGSRDKTEEIINEMAREAPERITVVSLSENRGKAAAVREGVLSCLKRQSTDLVGYWDADMATPLESIPEFMQVFSDNESAVMVSGCRVKRLGADIRRKAARHVLGRAFATLSSIILKLPLYDSQCGAKIFRSEVAGMVFEKPFMTRWVFDVEIFARIKNVIGYERCLDRIVEYPLHQWKDVSGAKLRLRDFLLVPIDLMKVFLNYR